MEDKSDDHPSEDSAPKDTNKKHNSPLPTSHLARIGASMYQNMQGDIRRYFEKALAKQIYVVIFLAKLRTNLSAESIDFITEHLEEVQAALAKCKIEHSLLPLLQVTPGELTTRRCLILIHCLPRYLGPGVVATRINRCSTKALQ